jgi:DNA-binding response OmpR family regulator
MRRHIIVAEDDPDMRALVGEALRNDGYDVAEASDGGRLLVLLARCSRCEVAFPDLIVSDIRMPVMSGLGMLKGVRDAHWSVPVVLMTAFPDHETRWKAESFAAEVLAKPFRMNELCDLVTSTLLRPTRGAAGAR